jgi:hypothetical protein
MLCLPGAAMGESYVYRTEKTAYLQRTSGNVSEKNLTNWTINTDWKSMNQQQKALRLTFPKLKPLERNRVTGIEITYQSPVETRLCKEAIEETRALGVEDYSVSVRLENIDLLVK